MSREPKKPKQQQKVKGVQNQNPSPTASAAVEASNQPHNVKKQSQGPNTKR